MLVQRQVWSTAFTVSRCPLYNAMSLSVVRWSADNGTPNGRSSPLWKCQIVVPSLFDPILVLENGCDKIRVDFVILKTQKLVPSPISHRPHPFGLVYTAWTPDYHVRHFSQNRLSGRTYVY